jgi:hypothetical protein
MNAFVACAKVTFSTLVATFFAFMTICSLWYLALLLGYNQIAVTLIFRLNEITTVFIGLAAGWYVARHYRTRPVLIAAVSALLVEALHVSIGGGSLMFDARWRVPAMLVVAVAIAIAAAWILMKILPPPATGPGVPAAPDIPASAE